MAEGHAQIIGWGYADELLEGFAEMIDAVEAHAFRDLRNIAEAVFQQALRLFDAPLAHIAHGRHAVGLGKKLAEIDGRDAGSIRDQFVGDHRISEMALQIFDGGQDAADAGIIGIFLRYEIVEAGEDSIQDAQAAILGGIPMKAPGGIELIQLRQGIFAGADVEHAKFGGQFIPDGIKIDRIMHALFFAGQLIADALGNEEHMAIIADIALIAAIEAQNALFHHDDAETIAIVEFIYAAYGLMQMEHALKIGNAHTRKTHPFTSFAGTFSNSIAQIIKKANNLYQI